MDPATATAAINAAGQLGNAGITVGTSLLNRKWARQDYERQRRDNLADWQMQNAYNSPTAQMQRLKEAGLNPNLVYGTGAVANNSQLPKSADIRHVQMEAPQFDPASVMGQYFNVQTQQAQIDNLKVQKTVMEQEAILKSVQALNTLADTDSKKENTTNVRLLRETTLEAARKNIEKLTADIESTKTNTFYTLQENMRKQELQPLTIKTMNEQVKNYIEGRKLSQQQRAESIERINNMIKDGKLKDIEIRIRDAGGNPNDPYWQKKLIELIEKYIFGNDRTEGMSAPIEYFHKKDAEKLKKHQHYSGVSR